MVSFKLLPTLFAAIVAVFNPNTVVNAQNDTGALDIPFEPYVIDLLEGMADNRINLTTNAYLWNVSYVIKLFNEKDPDWYLSFIPSTVLGVFAHPYLLEQFPQYLMEYWCCDFDPTSLCDYLEGNCPNGTGGSTANNTGYDWCGVWPLITSKHSNPIADGNDPNSTADVSECGLRCSAGGLVYGLTNSEQDALDTCKVIGTTFCFITVLFLFVNQVLDQKYSKEKFSDKPLIHHCPYFISFSVFMIMIMMTVGELTGKSEIVCNHDDNSFSFRNPTYGQNGSCTVHSLFFHTVLMSYIGYTVLLAFVIFRQFYKPLNPLWGIRNLYWHLGMVFIIFIIEMSSLITSEIDGIWPMGVCLPGVAKKGSLFGFVVFPFLIGVILTVGFLAGCIYLLHHTVKAKEKVVINKDSIQSMRDLARRMLWYTMLVAATLILLTATGFRFYVKHTPMRESMSVYIKCLLQNQFIIDTFNVEPSTVCERTDKLNVFWFISWIIACFLAVLGQLILSCHSSSRSRLQQLTTRVTSKLGVEATGGSKGSSKKSSKKSKSSKKKSKKENEIQLARVTSQSAEKMDRKITAFDQAKDAPHLSQEKGGKKKKAGARLIVPTVTSEVDSENETSDPPMPIDADFGDSTIIAGGSLEPMSEASQDALQTMDSDLEAGEQMDINIVDSTEHLVDVGGDTGGAETRL